MIELPESRTLKRQLEETVLGKRIIKAEAGHSPHGFAFYSGDPGDYSMMLAGRTVSGAGSFGGILELELEDMRLVFNDGVNLRFAEAGKPLPKKHQLYIQFEDETYLYATIQMYGGIAAEPLGKPSDNSYYQAAREKPDPLSEEFSREYFEGIAAAAPDKLSVKGLLATEQRIPGLGNGCLHDILWNAGLNPRQKAKELDDTDKLYESVKNTLQSMTRGGGRNTEKDLFGNPGGYEAKLSSKTWQYPCLRCGGAIVRKAYMGGNVYYCGDCQRMQGK